VAHEESLLKLFHFGAADVYCICLLRTFKPTVKTRMRIGSHKVRNNEHDSAWELTVRLFLMLSQHHHVFYVGTYIWHTYETLILLI
jgi:hypothetical protein